MSRLRITKISQPANPPGSTGELYYDITTGKPQFLDGSTGNILTLGGIAIPDFRLIKITKVLQGTVLYTPSAGIKALFVQGVGGGGAGGSCATGTSTGSGGGGGGGAYSHVFLTGVQIKASYTVQVGAGGTPGATGANPGGNGTDTTFDTTPYLTAKGGTGGGGDTAAAPPRVAALGGVGGSQASGVGDVAVQGENGGIGVSLAAASAFSGRGGSGGGFTSGGGIEKIAQGTGNSASLYGGGGSGGLIISSGASVAGGSGANGILIIWEFA